MATKILDKYGEDIHSLTLIPSGGGVFEISKDNSIIYSKKELGRFPDENEVFKLIGF
ncbi:MAG: SelT/SelW/SelH family protein [bacterium TMED144]|nr:MAG: SelT/SelW/SelH family protein [bacterium TMED144]